MNLNPQPKPAFKQRLYGWLKKDLPKLVFGLVLASILFYVLSQFMPDIPCVSEPPSSSLTIISMAVFGVAVGYLIDKYGKGYGKYMYLGLGIILALSMVYLIINDSSCLPTN